MDTERLVESIKAGTIDPKQAVAQFELPSKHISVVELDDLKIDIMSSGFATLDGYKLLKKNRSELIVLGARPSMGKSAFLCQLAKWVARDMGVLLFSLEMDAESITARLLAAEAGVPLNKIQEGGADRARLAAAKKELNKLNYFIDDRPRLDVGDIMASARNRHAQNPLGLVIVDYLQLVQVRPRNTRHEEIGDITGNLKALAKELRCPILVASQLSRACQQRGNDPRGDGDYRPQLSDLRDSGCIEQDADMVLFLSREYVYNQRRMNEADIGIAKNKNGKTGWEVFKFLGSMTKFVDPMGEVGDVI